MHLKYLNRASQFDDWFECVGVHVCVCVSLFSLYTFLFLSSLVASHSERVFATEEEWNWILTLSLHPHTHTLTCTQCLVCGRFPWWVATLRYSRILPHHYSWEPPQTHTISYFNHKQTSNIIFLWHEMPNWKFFRHSSSFGACYTEINLVTPFLCLISDDLCFFTSHTSNHSFSLTLPFVESPLRITDIIINDQFINVFHTRKSKSRYNHNNHSYVSIYARITLMVCGIHSKHFIFHLINSFHFILLINKSPVNLLFAIFYNGKIFCNGISSRWDSPGLFLLPNFMFLVRLMVGKNTLRYNA